MKNEDLLKLFPNIEDLRTKLAKNPNHKWKKRDTTKLLGLCYHQELGWSSIEDVAKYHTGPKSHLKEGGVASISYTMAVRKNGSICLCNDIEDSTWSQGYDPNGKYDGVDENKSFLSVSFEGLFKGPGVTDKSAGDPTAAQIKSAITIWEAFRDHFKWDNKALKGHFDFGKPACPGYTLQSIIEGIRTEKSVYKELIKYDLSTSKSRQKALLLLGYKIDVDGVWGIGSKGTLTQFEKDNGLKVDGVWDELVETKMVSLLTQKKLLDKLK
jgi:hypothetical protein